MKYHTTILRHLKTGGYYFQLKPKLDWRRESDMHKMFAYRSLQPKDKDVANMVFLRPIEELEDNRFEVQRETYTISDSENTLVELIHSMNAEYQAKVRMISVLFVAAAYLLFICIIYLQSKGLI